MAVLGLVVLHRLRSDQTQPVYSPCSGQDMRSSRSHCGARISTCIVHPPLLRRPPRLSVTAALVTVTTQGRGADTSPYSISRRSPPHNPAPYLTCSNHLTLASPVSAASDAVNSPVPEVCVTNASFGRTSLPVWLLPPVTGVEFSGKVQSGGGEMLLPSGGR